MTYRTPSRYHPSTMAYNFTAIEKKWQKYWLANKTFAALDPCRSRRDAQGVHSRHVPPTPAGPGFMWDMPSSRLPPTLSADSFA